MRTLASNGGMSVPGALLLVTVIVVLLGLPFLLARWLVRKAGLPQPWALVVFVPGVGLGALVVFALLAFRGGERSEGSAARS